MGVQEIQVSEQDFIFETVMRIRSTEVNIGQFLTNESMIHLLSESRMRFFYSKKIKQVNSDFHGLVVTDIAVNMPERVSVREELMIEVGVVEINERRCVIHYRMSRLNDFKLIGKASTVLVNFDYRDNKTIPMTRYFIDSLHQQPFEV